MSTNSLMSFNNFLEVITIVYKSTPSNDQGLCNIVSQICVKHIKTLIDKEAFKTVVKNIGDFGVDVLYKAFKYNDKQLEQALAKKVVLENELKDG